MRRFLPVVALAACAPVPAPATPDEPLPPAMGGGACDAKAAATLVGKPVDAALVARAQKLAGAQSVRVIGPGMAVTMDYRSGRLNIEHDAGRRATRFYCG